MYVEDILSELYSCASRNFIQVFPPLSMAAIPLGVGYAASGVRETSCWLLELHST